VVVALIVLVVVLGALGSVASAADKSAPAGCTTRTLTGRTDTFLGGQGPWTLGTVSHATALSVLTSDGYANRRNVNQTGEKADMRIGGVTVLVTTDVPDPKDADSASITSTATFAAVSGELTIRHARPASEGPNSLQAPAVTVTECPPPPPTTTTVAPQTSPPTSPPTTVKPTTTTTVAPTTTTTGPPATFCPDGTPVSSLDDCTPGPTTTTTIPPTVVDPCVIVAGGVDCDGTPLPQPKPECVPRSMVLPDGVTIVFGAPAGCPVSCPVGTVTTDGLTYCPTVTISRLPETGAGPLWLVLAGLGFVAAGWRVRKIANRRRSAVVTIDTTAPGYDPVAAVQRITGQASR
jgi:LPXTG-motif cell wall-anchored protein